MSANTNQQKCVVCSAYLFEEDDVVYCPTCGAPHHRDCYNYVGKCALDYLHGTDKQYKKAPPSKQDEKDENNIIPPSKTKNCRGCMKTYPNDARFCPYCGLPSENFSPYLRVNPFGKETEIKDDTEIEDGITALETAKVVTVNTIRYIPKFLSLEKDKKSSWNWAAVLFPHAWFAYRKMYKQAVVAVVFMLISTLFSLPLMLAVNQLPVPAEEINGTLQAYAYYLEHIAEIGAIPVIMAFFGGLINIAVRVFSGIYGDWIYRGHILTAVGKIRKSENPETDIPKLSGISPLGFCIALFSVNLLFEFIAIFLI